MHISRGSVVALVIAAVLAGAIASADVKLPAVFTDGAVLQQGMSVPVWGWADSGEKVTVAYAGQKVSTVAKDGKWMLRLQPLKAGGPAPMTVTGKNEITLLSVYVGEVWVASGQSNMQFGLRGAIGSEEAIQTSANPLLRLFSVPNVKADQPLEDVKAQWVEAGPNTTPGFSAVAYYFARDLQKALGIPVGIIHTSWGGSPAEVWMSRPFMAADPEWRAKLDASPAQIKAWEAAVEKFKADLPKIKADDAKLIAAVEEKAKTMPPDEGKKLVQDTRSQVWRREQGPGKPWVPTELYNGMIAPLIPFAIRGAIWYQGESNAGAAYQYRRLFTDMIRNWRRDWGEGDFTFLAVQLAPFMKIQPQPGNSAWAELREAQLMATQTLPNVGMAVITDVGEENDIHPRKKAPVGARLCAAALGIAYHQPIEYSGPVYQSVKFKGTEAILSFTHVGQGLEARGGRLTGFAICGADQKWVWAAARIKGDKVVVYARGVKQPVAVRFGWADYPVVNLWNKDGFPASPFRTDDFQMVTGPKKP